MSPADKKKIPVYGREREVYESRLNAFKPVQLGNRRVEEELSWVLYDRDDANHQRIPRDIRTADDLPRGAVVVSVDMTELSRREAELIRESYRPGEAVTIPPHGHAIYITAHEHVLQPMARGLRRQFDKRSHDGEPRTPENQDQGVGVLWDRNPEREHDERYHLRVAGNNHPESPAPGLRRVCIDGSVKDLLSRLALDMPTNIPHYHAHDDKPMLGNKTKVMSAVVADEFGMELTRRITMSSGAKEVGFSHRFSWPQDAERNPVRRKIKLVDDEAARIEAKYEAEYGRAARGVKPTDSHSDRAATIAEQRGAGWKSEL